MTYVKHVSRSNTPQTEPLKGQVKNSAGGYCYQISPFDQLRRFLILGCEGGSYYATERKLTKENATCIDTCIDLDPFTTVNTIAEISESGRAIKNDPCVFALAVAASNPKSSRFALANLNKVCRIGTHLFQFVEACDEMRGWGRGLRDAVSNWYLSKTPEALAMQVTKYAQRNGWSHRDVLRLAHPFAYGAHNEIFQYVTQRDKWQERGGNCLPLLNAVEKAKTANEKQLVKLIGEYGLVREHIPTEHLNSPKVWEALLENMPITATIRNLGKMSSIGLIKPLSNASRIVIDRITSNEVLKRGRVHPFSLLVAMKTYSSGHGFRGSLTWNPDSKVVDALNNAFYKAFGFVEPTGKNFLFGIDVSGSMGSKINNTNVSCRSAAACLALVTEQIEPNCWICGFHTHFQNLNITSRMRLDDVEKKIEAWDFGATDCAVAIEYARKNKLEVDSFVIITDNETFAGHIHPTVALEKYRKEMGRDAKLIVVAMTATNYSIADPNDPRQLDIVGFDASGPQVISEFSKL